jgi:hypothetical protein
MHHSDVIPLLGRVVSPTLYVIFPLLYLEQFYRLKLYYQFSLSEIGLPPPGLV